MSKRHRDKRPGSAADKNNTSNSPDTDKLDSKPAVPPASIESKPAVPPASVEARPAVSKPAASAKRVAPTNLTPQAAPTVRAPAAKTTPAPRPARKSSLPLPPPVMTAPVTPVETNAPVLLTSAIATVVPPFKRARNGSQPRMSPNGPVASILASEPTAAETGSSSSESEDRITPVEPAATAEPTLEVAASIAVASDRADSAQAARLARGSSDTSDRLREAAAFGSSQSLLSTDYYFRQYGAQGMRSLAAEVDDFGFDPHVDNKVKPLLDALCKRYFRVELVGAEKIPAAGRALLVANRAGALPWDGLVLRTALRSLRPSLSPLRWLVEDSVIHYPFMGVVINRLGAVRACPENAERLLAQNRLVAVFPEGAQGSRKLFRDRYRLQRFGRGGYVKLALKLGVPIFPTAIIGAEEINPVLGRSRLLGRVLGSDSVPLTPTFPWFGLAGLLPAPVRWRIAVGEAIDLSQYGPDAADDALVVHRLNEQIRSSLQALVEQGKSARGNALFG